MKIMIMSQYYPPNYTAAATRVYEMAKHLSSKKEVSHIDLVVWNPLFNRKGPTPDLPNVSVHEIGIGKNKAKKFFKYQDPNPIYALMWLGLTAKFCINKKPDLVMFSTPPGIILTGALWCRLFGIKYVIDYRDNWQDRNIHTISKLPAAMRISADAFHRILEKIAIGANKSAHLTTTVHKSIASKLESRGSTNVLVVPNGININEIQEAEEMSQSDKIIKRTLGKKFIVYVGHLGLKYYAPEILFSAIKEAKNSEPGIELWIFTSKKDKNIRRKAVKAGIDDRVKYISSEHTELLSIIKHAQFGYMPLKPDDPQAKFVLPAKMFDYVSAGLPILVVASRTSTIYKFVKEHGNGISLTWDEKDKLPSAVLELLGNMDYREKAEKLAPEFIKDYDRQQFFDSMYNRIIEIED